MGSNLDRFKAALAEATAAFVGVDLGTLPNLLEIDLQYPRQVRDNPEQITTIEVGLCDVRAADAIRIRFDFERDGWSILQASTFEWSGDDEECDADWQEVAFVQAWGREKKREDVSE